MTTERPSVCDSDRARLEWCVATLENFTKGTPSADGIRAKLLCIQRTLKCVLEPVIEEAPVPSDPLEETFTDNQINQAIKQFLDYGEQSYIDPDDILAGNTNKGHKGYFSGPGWAARVLRYHLKQREGNALPSDGG